MAEIVDLSMEIHHETASALLLSDDGDRANAVWIPKSQIEDIDRSKEPIIEVSIPEWLAHKKGLI
ncbi:MAG: hypothetical protein AAFP81_17285 [Pseudomonadota bacterium]